MATTTIHIPEDLLRQIDQAARKRGISRNKYVLSACAVALSREAGEWPEGFFDAPPGEDLSLLREATVDLEKELRSRRRNRGAVAL